MFKFLIILFFCLILLGCTSSFQPQFNDLFHQLKTIPINIITEQNDVKIILPWRSPDELTVLAAVIKTLHDYPDTNVKIVGYDNHSYHERSNIMVSEQRAKEIAHYIVKHHIRPRRVQSQGVGSARQMAEKHIEIIFFNEAGLTLRE